jgi:uncharacterized repeat protein (TIGR01451 family)
MYQAVWKLTALSVVVAVGVLVVVLAQRGMQEDDAADKNDVAATDTDGTVDDQEDMGEASEPPLQGEPEMADDVPFGAAVSVAGRNARRKTSAPRRNPVPVDDGLDEDDDQPIQRTANVDNDPFGDDEDTSSRASAAIRARRKAPTTAGQKRGPVLMLDSPDEDESAPESDVDSEEPKGKGSGPRLLGASNNARTAPDRQQAAAKINDDPFADEDDSPKAPAKRDVPTDDDDDPDLAADATPPAELPRMTPVDRPRSLRGIQPDDSDDEPVETPTISRSAPRMGKIADEAPATEGSEDPGAGDAAESDVDEKGDISSKLPTAAERRTSRPLDTIEPDDRDGDDRPVKLRPGKGPDLGLDLEAAPEETASQSQGEPALPGADSTPTDDAPVDDDPAPGKPELPQLTIDKIAPPTAVLGEPMIYHIQVRNNGYLPAHNVTVEDVVPENVKIDGSIPQAQLKQNRLVWKLGTLPAGQEKKIAVRVIPQSEGTIGGVATVNFTPPPLPAAAPADRNAPRIKFVVESPRKAAVNSPVDFKFKIQNVGRVPATGVTIRDVLPRGLKHAEGDDLEFTIGQIPPGKSQDVKLTLTAAVTGPTVNRVVVTADGNVSEEAEVQLEIVDPTLAVTRSGPKKLFPGKVGRYANTVTNPGGQPISGVTLLEVVPAGMEFVEADQGGLYDPVKRNVIWQLKQLRPAESKTVKVSLRPTARGAQISVVRAFDSSGASGETVGTTHVAGVPALKIEIGELASLVEPGEMVKVPVRVFNRGSDAATGVRTSVAVPAGMQFVSARAPVEHRVQAAGGDGHSGGEVQFAPIGKIDAKGDAVYELTFKARAPGATRVEVQTRCEQMSEAIRSEEPMTIVAPQ